MAASSYSSISRTDFWGDVLPPVVAAILTSTVISTILGAMLKVIFDRRWGRELERLRQANALEVEELKQEYAIELEKFKQDSEHKKAFESALFPHRAQVYPAVSHTLYRIKNGLRQDQLLVDSQLQILLRQDLQGLTDLLLTDRFYFQRDGLFEPLHEFKNECAAFLGSLPLAARRNRQATDRRQEVDQLVVQCDESLALVAYALDKAS
ncbi:hypothetical protein AB0F72_28620 [Actinoplanes sp. NPDC023936]|uniref:hypothetical protein n=1 Tax=Actinoplanes sp. NPDC023936 TaxID=3154910 RepID=UPI0033C65E00